MNTNSIELLRCSTVIGCALEQPYVGSLSSGWPLGPPQKSCGTNINVAHNPTSKELKISSTTAGVVHKKATTGRACESFGCDKANIKAVRLCPAFPVTGGRTLSGAQCASCPLSPPGTREHEAIPVAGYCFSDDVAEWAGQVLAAFRARLFVANWSDGIIDADLAEAVEGDLGCRDRRPGDAVQEVVGGQQLRQQQTHRVSVCASGALDARLGRHRNAAKRGQVLAVAMTVS